MQLLSIKQTAIRTTIKLHAGGMEEMFGRLNA